MTLKELLDSLSFDEIAPYLIRHYTYDYAPGDLVPYKQHFDYLRSLNAHQAGAYRKQNSSNIHGQGQTESLPFGR